MSKLKKISKSSKTIKKSTKQFKIGLKNASLIALPASMEKRNFVKKPKPCAATKMTNYASNKGIILYGRIKKITETEIFVSLPQHRQGKVSILSISDSYKAQLKKSFETPAIEIHTLSEQFQIGQPIYCQQTKWLGLLSELSLVPIDINKQIKANSISSGFQFYGAIKEIDGNDYLIETGIRHFKGVFTSTEEKYLIGDFLHFCVNEIVDSSTVLVEAHLNLVDDNNRVERDEAFVNFSNIVPGTKVKFTVTNCSDKIANGTILFDESIAAVLLDPSSDVAVGQEVICIIVGIVPTTRIVYLQQEDIATNILPVVQSKSGELVQVNIVGKSNNLVNYHIKEHNVRAKAKCFDITTTANCGTDLVAKVYDIWNSNMVITNRLEYFLSDGNILNSSSRVSKGDEYYGTVIREFEKFYLVRFFDSILGTISSKFIDKSQFYIGKIFKFIVNGLIESDRNGKQKIYLKLAESNDTLLGTVFNDAIVLSHNPYRMEVQLNQLDSSQIGYIPVGTLTNDVELDRILYSFFKDGSTIDCVQIDGEIYTVSNESSQKDFEDLDEGDIVTGYIKNLINDNEIETYVPIRNVKNKMAILPFDYNKQHFNYFPYKPIMLKVYEKNVDSSTITCGIANLDVAWNGNLDETINKFENYLIYYTQVLNQLGYSFGDKVEGTIIEIGEETTTKIKIVDTNETAILEVNSKTHVVNQRIATLLTSINCNALDNQVTYNVIEKSKKIVKNSNVEENATFDCEIILVKDNFVVARSTDIRAPLIYMPKFVHDNDFNCVLAKYFQLNSIVKIIYVKKFNSLIGIGLPLEFHRKYYKTETENHKDNTETSDDDDDEAEVSEIVLAPKRARIDNDEADCMAAKLNIPSVSNLWNMNLKSVCSKTMPEDDEADNAGDDDNEVTTKISDKKSKKLTPVERREAVKQEEVRIREIEEKLADTNRLPESIDEYERVIMANPNDSSLWIKYMAFHLQSTEIDRARKVCHQGLKTISYREETDKLNLWIALLNLEIRYGTLEQFQRELTEALKVNDQLELYTKCLDILMNAKKLDVLNEIMEKVRRKFGKTHKQVWLSMANIYFQLGENQKAIKLLGRAMTSLPEKEHVDTIIQFAILMNKNNESSQAHAHLEQILTSYPKRVDVWSLYIDMLTKSNLIDAARNTLDRAISQRLNVKKMKTLFKKYLEFERMYGTEINVNRVKQLAEEYVEHKVQNS